MHPDYFGTPIIGSPVVPRDQIVRVDGRIFFHRHTWVSGRKRKPHGRSNGPRRWKTKTRVCDYGFMDRLREAM